MVESFHSPSSRFSRIFISVISFSIIPVLVLNLIFNYLTYQHAREKYLLSVNDSLVTHALAIDEKIRGLENLISVIEGNPDVLSFVVDPSVENYQQHARILDFFSSFVDAYDFVSSIYLYSAVEGILLASDSGVSPVNMFYDTAWIDQFNHHFLGYDRLPARTVTDSNGKSYSFITLLSNLPQGSWDKTAGLIINLNTNVLFSKFTSGGDARPGFQIINGDGYVLDHPEPEQIGNFVGNGTAFRTAASRNTGFFVRGSSKTRTIVSFYTAPYTRWIFIYESDINELVSFSRRMLLANLAIIILALLVLLLIGIRVSRQLYYPLESLGNSSEILEYARPLLQEHTLHRLVFRRNNDENHLQDMLRLCGMSEPEGECRVLVFRIDAYKTLCRERDTVSLRLVKEALHTRTRAWFPAGSLWMSGFTEEDTLCCILKENAEEAFCDWAENIVSMVPKDFPFSVSCGIGKGSDNLRGIHMSYLQAYRAVQCSFFSGWAAVHRYVDPPAGRYRLSPALESERNLIACVKSGNTSGIEFLADTLLRQVEECTGTDPQRFRRILSSTVRSLMEIREKSLLPAENSAQKEFIYLHDDLQERETLADLREWLLSVCRDTALQVQSARMDKTAPNARRIARYLEQNLEKAELSLIDIGDAVGLSPSYVSRIFKDYFGTNYIDYLNRSRVESSKKYLLNPEIPVGEVARKTGFSSLQTFIRVFKKYENMSPGRFRKLEAVKKEVEL